MPPPLQGFEDDLGLTSIPVNFAGLLLCVGFWVGVYYACLGFSAFVGGEKYRTLAPKLRLQWDNSSWAVVHGVIAFVVRVSSWWRGWGGTVVGVAER